MRRPRKNRCALLFLAGLATCLSGSAELVYDISGTVSGPDGEALADAHVWLLHDRQVRRERSDEAGAFAFVGVPGGTITIVAYDSRYALGAVSGHLLRPDTAHLVLEEPSEITLHVLDRGGDQIEGARLKHLTLPNGVAVPFEDLANHGLPVPRSDEQGALSIGHIPHGSQAGITVGHPRYADASLPVVPAGAVLSVQLSGGVSLRGRVTDSTGAGIDRARVSLYQTMGAQQLKYGETLTDPEGFYAILAPPARYVVATRHPDYAPSKPEPALLTEPAVVDLELRPPARIHGITRDTESQPVPGVRIAHSDDQSVFNSVISDYQGRFEIVVPRAAGTLRVIPPQGMTTTESLVIPFDLSGESSMAMAPIELRPLPGIRGIVDAGDGVRRDKVVLTVAYNGQRYETVADEHGRFEIALERFPVGGTVQLHAEHALRFLRTTRAVDLETNQSLIVRLQPYEPDIADRRDSEASGEASRMIGQPAPEPACQEWLNVGALPEPPSIAGSRGKVLVLSLWGGFSESETIGREIDRLNLLTKVYRDVDDVAVLSVHDAAAQPHDVAANVEKLGITFPVCCDLEPAVTFDRYNTNIVPQTFVIDKKGVVRYIDTQGRLLDLIKHLRRLE